MGTAGETIRIPIFPLENVVLFPDARQVLHIFEPRYREMTEDALAGDQQIGMVLLRDTEDEDLDPPPVYVVGCVGRIVSSRRLPDGRFLIVLEGISRFRILQEEPSGKPYRVVTAELLPEPSFAAMSQAEQEELEAARRELESRLMDLTRATHPESVQPLLERTAQLDPVQLAHAVAFGLDCSPIEKQGLLEAPGPLERCRQVVSSLAFRAAEALLPDTSRTVN
jgi:Lon protease-like protein